MKFNKRIIITGLFLVVFLMVGLCLPALAATPKQGGRLTVGLTADVEGFDPNKHGLTSAYVHWNIFEALTRMMPDGSVVPALAIDWEWLSDTEIRFKLREGVKFHSGNIFNAEAVKWNIERYTNPNDPGVPYALVGTLITDVIIEDEYTVVFKLSKPFAPFLAVAASSGGIPMADQKLFEELGDEFAQNPSGTGPFKFKDWVYHDHVLLERNDDWWGGAPYLDELKFDIIPDDETRIMALETGQVDLICDPSPTAVERLKEDPNYIIESIASDRIIKLDYDFEVPNWQNRNMRKAISLAIDTEAIAETMGELAETAYSVITKSNWGYFPQEYEYNSDKALELFAEEGWEQGSDGILRKDGKQLEVTIGVPPDRDPRNASTAQMVDAYLREIGIDVTIISLETGTFFASLRRPKEERSYDLYFGSFGTQYLEPTHGLYGNYHGDNLSPAGLNFSRRSGGVLDTLMEAEFKMARWSEARLKVLEAIQIMFYEDALAIPLYDLNNVWAMKSNVKGFAPHPVFVNQYLYAGVWLE